MHSIGANDDSGPLLCAATIPVASLDPTHTIARPDQVLDSEVLA
jgi:hypothetical protein